MCAGWHHAQLQQDRLVLWSALTGRLLQVERATAVAGTQPTYRIRLAGGRPGCTAQQLGVHDCGVAAPLLASNATDPQWWITPSTSGC